MGIKALLESLDNVPAELHDLYEEKDGKFVLDLEDDIKTHPSVSALQNAYKTEQTRRKDLTRERDALKVRLDGLPDDFDATAYEELIAQAEAGDGGKPDEQVEKVRTQMQNKIAALEKKHEVELGKKDEQIAAMSSTLERHIIDGGLSAAMDEANIDPKHKKKLAPYLKASGKIKIVEDDGTYNAVVETDMGETTISKFVSDWAGSDDGKEYVSKASGLNANGSDSRRIEGNPFAKQNWSKTEQGQMIRSDRGKAERLAKAAGFKTLDAAAVAREPVAA